MLLLCASLAGGACAFLPGPFAPLWSEPSRSVLADPSDSVVSETWFAYGRDVVLDGGSDPDVALVQERMESGVILARPLWSVSASAGTTASRARFGYRNWGLRWIPSRDDRYDAAFRVGRNLRAVLALREDQGRFRATLGAAIPLGPVALEGEASRTRGDGSLLLLRDGESPLPLGWAESGWCARGGLSFPIAELGRASVALEREESHPGPTEGRYRFEVRAIRSGWRLGWSPRITGPWLDIQSSEADWRSQGWSDTLGSDARFHDLRIVGTTRRVSGGWRFRSWGVGAHTEERTLDAPKASFFTPFLSWNALDLSPWSPVGQILSDQREHLSGSLEYRAHGADISWRRTGRRFDIGLEGGLSWRSLETHLLHRRTRLSFLGAGWKFETDSVGAPRLRALLAPLALYGTLHLGGFGDLSALGRAAVPLRIERLRRDGAAPTGSSGSSDSDDDIEGLWSVGVGWRGGW